MRLLTLLFIPGFAIIGATNVEPQFLGVIIGSLVGMACALLFGGGLPKQLVDGLFKEDNHMF